MFPDPHSYHLRQTAVMHRNCPACGLDFIPEPGYYYGAMYVSYAFTIAVGVSVFVANYVLYWAGIYWYLGLLTAVLLIMAPWTFRTARVIWLGFFQRFNPEIRASILKNKKK